MRAKQLWIGHPGASPMSACFALLVALTTVAGPGDRPALVRFGSNLSRGVLVNHSPGTRPSDPPDPARPTVVFVHGINPMPRTVHFTMCEQLAGALARRGGAAFNVLGWDWNAATIAGLSSRANREGVVAQGRALAAALIRGGIPPARTHLIGHSSGAIVATVAARTLLDGQAGAVAHLTLLDPAAIYHEFLFDRLVAGSVASRVENYWAPGPSGYGRHAPRAGVWNVRVDGPTPYLGTLWLLRSSHLQIVDWYIATAEDPAHPGGFNTSLLLGEGG